MENLSYLLSISISHHVPVPVRNTNNLDNATKSGLQHALNGLAAACDIDGMKICTSKPQVLHLSRNSVQCSLQAGSVSLKRVEKFLGMRYTSEKRLYSCLGFLYSSLSYRKFLKVWKRALVA